MKERRNKQQIYADILNSINNESQDNDIKITRVQLSSKLSYDKLQKYLIELKKYNLIELKPKTKVTKKGQLFVIDSYHMSDNLKKLNHAYLLDNSSFNKQLFDNISQKSEIEKNMSNTDQNIDHKIKEYKQIQNAMNATIDELSKN